MKGFLDIFSCQLEKRKRSLIFGDINLDLLCTNAETKNYLNIIEESGFEILNKIDKHYTTRQTTTTGTILDHVTTDLSKNSFKFGLLDSSLSDHKQIYLELSKIKLRTKQRVDYETIDYDKLHKGITKAIYTNEENDYDCLENFIRAHK